MKETLGRFEIVEWLYDGLNGKIIPWTLEHGGTSHDPSVQAFVLKSDGQVLARAPDGQVYRAGSFATWLGAQADDFEKRFPRTRVPLVRADLVRDGEVMRCLTVDEAREAGRPVLLYVGREEREGQSRLETKETKASRRLERSTLDSKRAADAAASVEGLVLLRVDLGHEDHAAYAASLGVTKAPALLLLLPDVEEPEVLKRGISGASLAYRLKKLSE